MSDGPPLAKKIRSCSSSESTTILPLDEATAAALLDAVRRYEGEASRRDGAAAAEAGRAKDDVLAAMEALKRSHERLNRAEAAAAAASTNARAAREYRARWELQLVGKRPDSSAGAAEAGDEEGGGAPTDEDSAAGKHVSFAVPRHQHPPLAGPLPGPVGPPRRHKRKRIRVSEHGWGVYEGALDRLGEPHGQGVVTWESGGQYEGAWVDGKANGEGIMEYGNGDRYEGGWKDGCRFGRGTHHFKDGGVYEGQWRNAAPDGLGKMTLKNGSHYEGAWKDGKWHGRGIVRPVNGGEWEGTFHMGKCTVGTLRRPNGELEIGRYDSVNPDDVKEGVWWSIDRRHAWVVEGGRKKEQVDQARAAQIVARLGVPLPPELGPGPPAAAAAAAAAATPPIKEEAPRAGAPPVDGAPGADAPPPAADGGAPDAPPAPA